MKGPDWSPSVQTCYLLLQIGWFKNEFSVEDQPSEDNFSPPMKEIHSGTGKAARDLGLSLKQKVAFDCGWRPANTVKPRSTSSWMAIQDALRGRVEAWKPWLRTGTRPRTSQYVKGVIATLSVYQAYMGVPSAKERMKKAPKLISPWNLSTNSRTSARAPSQDPNSSGTAADGAPALPLMSQEAALPRDSQGIYVLET